MTNPNPNPNPDPNPDPDQVVELEQLPPPRLAQLRAPQRVAVVAEMVRRDEA